MCPADVELSHSLVDHAHLVVVATITEVVCLAAVSVSL